MKHRKEEPIERAELSDANCTDAGRGFAVCWDAHCPRHKPILYSRFLAKHKKELS